MRDRLCELVRSLEAALCFIDPNSCKCELKAAKANAEEILREIKEVVNGDC